MTSSPRHPQPLPTTPELADLSPEQAADVALAATQPPYDDGADQMIDGNAGRAGEKKPAWSKPSSSSAVEVGPVMGAVSWPALTKSARSSPKPLSVPDSPQDPTPAPVPVISSSPKKTNMGNQSPNSVKNHQAPTKQKSTKRSGPVNGGILPNSDDQPAAELASVEPGNKTNQNGADHNRSYAGGRRGNGGGNGSQHNRFGHRRDQDWGHRSFNGRDNHMQLGQHPRGGGPRPFPRQVPASAAAPIMGPPHLQGQHFRPPAGFPDMNNPLYPLVPPQPLETYGGMAFLHHAVPAAMLFPAVDPSHRAALLKQIDYYFSTENLCKDIYLRQQMNDQGWVPISLIARFNKVKQLTNNIQYIFDTVHYSTIVEVQGDKIRRRNDWMNWVLPQSNHFGSASGPPSPATPNYDALGVHLQSFSLEDGATINKSSSSGNFNEHSHVTLDPYRDGDGKASGHSDRFIRSTRSLSRSDTF
ncbi:hypothetical protein J5N97_016182 [Dioscorea zingiberensis]|uniref:HTH La-type RNA-binding domain-containing protein n=1 Tax=Dioscorea zingiberensis TaxID=325984 RepID=A0A9D5CKH0_9LILI|nr:hypothetical protein J5N97_016182 [Dioscorea zingiberensis]